MGVVDRTDEFRQILMELSAKAGDSLGAFDVRAPQAQSALNAACAEIGGEIHQASLKVQELRKMAKGKAIFNDKTNEIQELTHNIKQDLASLNQKLEALEANAKGTGPNKNYKAHSSNMVETLKTRWLEVTKDFKNALEVRSNTMEDQNKRRQLYAAGGGAASNPFAQRQRPSGNPDDIEGGGGGGGASMAMSVERGYTNSRAEAVMSVQRTIGELGQMFQKMAVMVSAQEEMIQRIDTDVTETAHNIDKAQENLLAFWHHISSNRMLIMKVFLILIFFVVFFVVFLA